MAIRPPVTSAVVSSYEDALYAEEDKTNVKRRPDLVVDRLYAKFQLGFWDVPLFPLYTGVAPYDVKWADNSPSFDLKFTSAGATNRDMKALAKGSNIVRIQTVWPTDASINGGINVATPGDGGLWTVSIEWQGITLANNNMAIGCFPMNLGSNNAGNTIKYKVDLVSAKIDGDNVIAIKFRALATYTVATPPVVQTIPQGTVGALDFVLWVMDNS